MRNSLSALITGIFTLLLSSCASTPAKPCSLGGQPARATSAMIGIGKKSCNQILDDSGSYVNDGKYYEWFLNDQIALVGEYKKGKKTGRWIEYDQSGKVVSQTNYENGNELPPAYEVKRNH